MPRYGNVVNRNATFFRRTINNSDCSSQMRSKRICPSTLVFVLFILLSCALYHAWIEHSIKTKSESLREYIRTIENNPAIRQLGFIEFSEVDDIFHERHSNDSTLSIQLLVVVEKGTRAENYRTAIDTLMCYAKIHNYTFLYVVDAEFAVQCPHQDKFFRRHCVAAQVLNRTDYTLFIDADIGVVNPERKIEEFIDDRFDIIFYDRIFNHEIAAGSYLVKNSHWSKTFLKGWADFEAHLPPAYHGFDNGAIHAYLVLVIFPGKTRKYSICFQLYLNSQTAVDLFAFEACVRNLLGISENFGRIRILEKGTSWVRDNWLTNSKWSPDRDFMIHAWKQQELSTYSQKELPLLLGDNDQFNWFNPLAGPIDLEKCTPRNSTWSYDPNLLTTKHAVDVQLDKIFYEKEKLKYHSLGILVKRLNL